jgi:DNA-binding beta-propeller fold protein YncE
VLERVQKIPLSGRPEKKLDHLALDARRNRLFVANMANRTLDVIDLKEGKLLKSVPEQRGIQGVTYAPDLDRVFVGLGVDGYCNAFDGETYAQLKSLPFPTDSDNVRYDPRTGVVYVAHLERSLGIVDAKTLAVKADLKLPGFPESLTLEKNRPRMYMNTPAPAGVMVFDTEKHEVIATYPLKRASGNYPLALDEPNRRLFVGCRKEPMVLVMDSETGKEITSVAIPGDIDDLYFDARRKRLYAACGEGFLVVIRQVDADRYEPVEKLPTSKLARTCLFDAEGNRLFLAVPRFGTQESPEIWVYRVRD